MVLIFGVPSDFFFGIPGSLSLAGVFINKGIELIDRFDSDFRKGLDPYQAVMQLAISHFCPNLMTIITTIHDEIRIISKLGITAMKCNLKMPKFFRLA